ncbi:hypothetical protein KC340_g8129 [Hortaea werneckii]|nr:hypothetical protein KC342_g8503 [Hortaea werneckii]KAI7096201.1 hypothetical protein KC339_g10537 [Hortaea werneckii]KAI7232345.1 hypothetical protein KC365_g6816 [Hortaea werneckii]KAI7318243.1 hypothetical protein KC340_g8129 [Hortaea werneckii]KAI7399365.1 hypothetical protein KC328_g4075 [Hortaea werneckii]
MAALVAYSDSEGSDTESAPAPAPPEAPKPAFSKTKEPRRIQVSLPKLQPEQNDDGDPEQPPAKRARTGGGFGGFNSFLPAPKRTAAPTTVKKGVSLKTSSEAAFSRAPPDSATSTGDTGRDGDDEYDEFGNRRASSAAPTTGSSKKEGEEVKIVGKATKFKPLSVANNKKKKSKPAVKTPAEPLEVQKDVPKTNPVPKKVEPPQPKAKRSLFSMQEDVTVPAEDLDRENEDVSESAQPPPVGAAASLPPTHVAEGDASGAVGNSLEDVASDLNLTAAQRRHLFGRGGGGKGVNIAHFNMDNEYAANEQIRQSGETIEHKAVKAVAPGKHSLQQLVNNARSNQESMEDKWAEGRRNQGGSQYGWGGQK